LFFAVPASPWKNIYPQCSVMVDGRPSTVKRW
jgi:hypothetical protein